MWIQVTIFKEGKGNGKEKDKYIFQNPCLRLRRCILWMYPLLTNWVLAIRENKGNKMK